MQSLQQLPSSPLPARAGGYPMEDPPQAIQASVPEEKPQMSATIRVIPSESEKGNVRPLQHAPRSVGRARNQQQRLTMYEKAAAPRRHHRRRTSSAWRLKTDGGAEDVRKSEERRKVKVPKRDALSLMPLPTIETVMTRSPPPPPPPPPPQQQQQQPSPQPPPPSDSPPKMDPTPAYKTVIHIPKPPALRRREPFDALLLSRVLRETARLRLDDADTESPHGDNEERTSPMTSTPSDEDSSSFHSFHTTASTFSSPSTPSTPSPASSTLALPSSSAYPSPASSPSSPPAWKDDGNTYPLSSIPLLDLGPGVADDDNDDEEMDWAWSMNGGEVVYGAAGVAVSPRAMMRGRNGGGDVCWRCACGEGGGDVDMELYVIDEEEEVDGR